MAIDALFANATFSTLMSYLRTCAATPHQDFAAASRDWERSARIAGPTSAALHASSSLAAAYGGQGARAAILLTQARAHASTSPSSNHAFITYVEGELMAVDNSATAISCYVAAVAEASRVGQAS